VRRWLWLLLALPACRCDRPRDEQPLEVHVRPLGLLEGEAHLHRTFDRLKSLELGQQERVGVAQLGASHTAGLFFSDEITHRLTTRFGGLGAGYVPFAPMRPHFAGSASASERSRVELTHEGDWKMSNALQVSRRQIWGLTSARAEAAPSARVRIDFHTDNVAAGALQLFYLDSGAPTRVELSAQERTHVLPMSARGSPGRVRVETLRFDSLPPTLELSVSGRPATLLGIAQERDGPGVIYDVLGLPGASVFLAQRHDKPAFIAQLRARQPSLFVLFYGTNESVMSYWTDADFRAHYHRLLATLRRAMPRAECLLISNTDRQIESAGTWVEAPHAERVEQSIRTVAARAGCAFWSARGAMGGRGGMESWATREPKLALADRVHLTELGYRTLAAALVEDLFAAYARRTEK
jgi:lysophospholipase L1-like esterase